ncbi:pyridoxamine 5'-phosphate oxidase family protein [Poseidonocella sp. HB161398]|uniref:pyridoxamine 5'-phosphate oxidase family protein n=1 Tax=Poseidonocella sp. HB161398 TaxID=2320855 RepID=UPI001108D527|nr:pyridoxamine 5'-phosphate oxidase family protein [Poseidonocella sp. HB161398]
MKYEVTDLTKVRRRPERAIYDRDLVHSILDEALVAHIGFVDDAGVPRVIPTAFSRIGEDVVIHGSTRNLLMTTLAKGGRACITVTLIDSLVAGRSGFGCSMDYRSVVIYSSAEVVPDSEKPDCLERIVQDIFPGHRIRDHRENELKATLVLRFPIREVSAKVRDAGCLDVEDDYASDRWAGRFPVSLEIGPAENCPRLGPEVVIPEIAAGLPSRKK